MNCASDYYRTSFDSLNCLMCHKVFLSNGDLYDHQRNDHFSSKYEKRFACIRCLAKTNGFAQMSNEMKTIGNAMESTAKETTFCSICDKFIRVAFWSRHERNHRDRVVYQCESCRKLKVGYFRFRSHLRQSPKCTDSMELNGGRAEKGPRSYTYQCLKCRGTFSRRSFKSHIEESDCYAENKCQTCLKRFVTKSALNDHHLVDCVNIKTNDKSFHTKKGLVSHSNVCQKWKKKKTTTTTTVRCDICKILVENNSNHWDDIHRRKSVVKLKRTVVDGRSKSCLANKIPTGIQFCCLLCDDSFGDREQLRFHLRKTHYCDKSVQTVADGQCETTWELIDTDSKHIVELNLKDEKMESSSIVDCDDDNNFQLYSSAAERVKTESPINFENMWTSNSDQFDNFADDDPGELSDTATSNDVIQYNVLGGMTMCCLCKNGIPDLINTDDVVEQQISQFGECVCLICFQLFNQVEKLRVHESTHFQENLDGHSIACRSCAWSSTVYYTDGDYFRLERELQCYMCSAKMGDLRTLRRHKRSHLSLCVFTCKVCNKKSISDERHRNHLRKHLKP